MAATEQASAGAVQIRSLKQQLDQYNVFYMGLNSYTAGVDQAARPVLGSSRAICPPCWMA